MADDLLVRLGDRIRKLRKARGWTQVVMAERVGIDRSFLADVERGFVASPSALAPNRSCLRSITPLLKRSPRLLSVISCCQVHVSRTTRRAAPSVG
jgi:DNA-binding XRE family transcriptional regulator